MSVRSIICAATLLTAAVQPVWASPAPPPAEAKAETAPPSARALQLAHQIVVTLHLSETIANMVKSMMPAMIDHRMKTDPNFKPEWRQPLIDATTEAAADVMPGFIKEAEVDYARVFTEEEMTQMLAFYGSPVGQSVLAKQSELTPLITKLMSSRLDALQADITTRFCSKIDCKKATLPAAPAGA